MSQPVHLDKIHTSSVTRRQVFRESVYPLVDGLTRGQSSTLVFIGGRRAGKWEAVLGSHQPQTRNNHCTSDDPRASILAPNLSPGGGSLGGRANGRQDAASLQAGPCSGGLISMILDMVYEHARQVGCASHRFRLSCSACEIGEHVVDMLQEGSLACDSAGSKGPKLLIRSDRDPPGNLLRLDDNPDIGATVAGLQDVAEELKSNSWPGRLKELLVGRLMQQRDVSDDSSKHYMLTIILEQSKRPTFQAHDAPKSRNTDRSHFIGLLPFRRAKLNIVVAGQGVSPGAGCLAAWPAVLDHIVDAIEHQAAQHAWDLCNLTKLLREPLAGERPSLVSQQPSCAASARRFCCRPRAASQRCRVCAMGCIVAALGLGLGRWCVADEGGSWLVAHSGGGVRGGRRGARAGCRHT